MVKLVSKSSCTGCMACADSCSKKAIFAYSDANGHIYPRVDVSLCVNCGCCIRVCPVLNLSKKTETQRSMPYAAWSSNAGLRQNSASGGIFASLAKTVLNHGGVVVGAKLSGFEVKHVMIDSLTALKELQGTKYMQGNLYGIYKSTKKTLDSGKIVLFSGVPCQVNALKQFLGREYDNLYTVDLICGGFPSSLPMSLLQRNNPDYTRVLSYRDKDNGWKSVGYQYSLKVENNRGEILNLGVCNLPIQAFGSSMTHRLSCCHCKFATPERTSDITIGDFWGDKRFPEQHYAGLSLVVIHSPKGRELLASSDVEYRSVTWHEAIMRNKALVDGRKFVRCHFARAFMKLLYKYGSYDFILRLYSGKGFWGLVYKINAYLLGRVSIIHKRIVYRKVMEQYGRQV